MVSAAIIGSTGLVGSHLLSTLLAAETNRPIITITRRAPRATPPILNAVIEADTTKWASLLSSFSPAPTAVYSTLGTTRAAAGSLTNQWKIDHDLNIELARAAKEVGAKTFVFISFALTRSVLSSVVPYLKMKNGVEQVMKELGFEHSIVLLPGLILGEREKSRGVEGLLQGLIQKLGWIRSAAKNHFGQEAEVIARAAVRAAQLAHEGKAPSNFWVIDSAEIIRLGKTE